MLTHPRLPRLLVALLGAILILFIVGPLLRLLLMASPASLGQALSDLASVTSAPAAEMALRPGLKVMVTVKATAIHLV
jgi:hypothetical protein